MKGKIVNFFPAPSFLPTSVIPQDHVQHFDNKSSTRLNMINLDTYGKDARPCVPTQIKFAVSNHKFISLLKEYIFWNQN